MTRNHLAMGHPRGSAQRASAQRASVPDTMDNDSLADDEDWDVAPLRAPPPDRPMTPDRPLPLTPDSPDDEWLNRATRALEAPVGLGAADGPPLPTARDYSISHGLDAEAHARAVDLVGSYLGVHGGDLDAMAARYCRRASCQVPPEARYAAALLAARMLRANVELLCIAPRLDSPELADLVRGPGRVLDARGTNMFGFDRRRLPVVPPHCWIRMLTYPPDIFTLEVRQAPEPAEGLPTGSHPPTGAALLTLRACQILLNSMRRAVAMEDRDGRPDVQTVGRNTSEVIERLEPSGWGDAAETLASRDVTDMCEQAGLTPPHHPIDWDGPVDNVTGQLMMYLFACVPYRNTDLLQFALESEGVASIDEKRRNMLARPPLLLGERLVSAAGESARGDRLTMLHTAFPAIAAVWEMARSRAFVAKDPAHRLTTMVAILNPETSDRAAANGAAELAATVADGDAMLEPLLARQIRATSDAVRALRSV
jgi:hypothetical protein